MGPDAKRRGPGELFAAVALSRRFTPFENSPGKFSGPAARRGRCSPHKMGHGFHEAGVQGDPMNPKTLPGKFE